MKTGKILIYGLLLVLGVTACEKDDTPEIFWPPRADFNYSPTSPLAGDEVLFDAEPRPGSGEIVSWNWNFGDESSTTSTAIDPAFVYENPGTYEVTLTVSDASQNEYQSTKTITVLPAPTDVFEARIVWDFTTNTEVSGINDGSSSPVIGDDGTIFYTESRAGSESKVIAVIDNGETAELKWVSASVGGDLPNAPSIGPDGNIFINAWVDERAISKLNFSDGSIIWSGGIGTDVSNNTPAVDSEGNTYHGSRAQGANGGVFSWSPTGEKRWEITGVGAFYASPVISSDENTVYFLNTSNGEVWAVNTVDGTTKWESPVGLGSGIHGSSLSMDADGTIYFTTNTHVVAITDEGGTGSVKWQTAVNDASNSGVVIGPEGELYVGSMGGLLALEPSSGEINWIFEAEIAESVPAVDVNGFIYVGTTDGNFYVVNPEGEQIKSWTLGDNVVNSPTITENGTVYIEATDMSLIKLYKITVENSGPADSPWPMKGQNVKNTGVAQ